MRAVYSASLLLSLFLLGTPVIAEEGSPRHVVFLAGTLDGHPKWTHEYEKACVLLAHMLRHSNLDAPLKTSVFFDGWPADETVLASADTIVVISGGSDQRLEDHPLMLPGRMGAIDREMKRGCGLVLIHWSTFSPREKAGERFLRWVGGYFDYESGPPPRNWYSAIRTGKTRPGPATLNHPITQGVGEFDLEEEWYYRMRFKEGDARWTPVIQTDIPDEPERHTVGWAVEREDGGRGFGFTGGHFFADYFVPEFQRTVLNAILWTAHGTVPDGGVTPGESRRIRTLVLTGHNHPAHNWQETSAALQTVLEQDPRVIVTIAEDPEFLAKDELFDFDLLVLNYANWERPGLSDTAKANLLRYLDRGHGLQIVHFANGAFHFSLPGAEDSDWPEYRNIVRRVWDHQGTSSHDPYGPFVVSPTEAAHPITEGLDAYQTTDELYFNQAGDEAITPLVTARSVVTGNDEPLAWAYTCGKSPVFQILLGHDAAAISNPGTARLIRRAAAWAVGQAPLELGGTIPRTR